MQKLSAAFMTAAVALFAGPAAGQEPGEHFITRDLSMSPDEAAASIRAIVEEDDDWLFLAEFPLKGGEVLALKICYLPLGPDIFAAGMHVAAMMPCGNLAFYEDDDQSRLSMLDLGFLTTLHPDPNLERAVEAGRPAFVELLDAALK
ncbi:MAG: DUF302 domain-containing protein [Rhizobiaceae bacterium]|nr:DUF302 domain-containing protein [Rhizobiaceae bacterium]MCV0407249.1 DUF302 domain-containing protein [Rhizobiaceae bacterium]